MNIEQVCEPLNCVMSVDSPPSSINLIELPHDMWLYIFSFFNSFQDLSHLRSVNKHFFILLGGESLISPQLKKLKSVESLIVRGNFPILPNTLVLENELVAYVVVKRMTSSMNINNKILNIYNIPSNRHFSYLIQVLDY